MKFQAVKCECGFRMATPHEHPVCVICGKEMTPMEKGSEEYEEFDKDLKVLFRGM